MIVLIDNYDSFTYNIYHYILHYRNDIVVVRNDDSLKTLQNIKTDAIVISPGPCHPKKSLLSLDAIDYFKNKVPILGVCLGMQAIGYYFGSNIRRAKRVMHGKIDRISHNNSCVFKNLENPMSVVRYHSLVVANVKNMTICAKSVSDQEIMAIENNDMKIYGVQFHPESFLTQNGKIIIKNFLEVIQ